MSRIHEQTIPPKELKQLCLQQSLATVGMAPLKNRSR